MIAHSPLHGSGQAGFPHPALALGDDAHATERVGMTDGRHRQPASDEAPHAIPEDAAVLAAPRKSTMPKPSYLESKKSQRRVVHGQSVIPDVSTHHRLQPLALFGDGFVHTSLKFGLHLVQFRLQPFAYRLPQHRKPSIAPLLYADVRKAKEVERLRFPFATPLPLVDRKRTELQQPRLLGMQFQVELPHSFREFRSELIGIRFVPESNHDVVCESHDDDIAVRALQTPRLDPQVEYVMKVDVRQERRSTSALGRPFFRPYSLPILQHAGPQPFLDEPHDAPVCHPMLDELHKPFVGKPMAGRDKPWSGSLGGASPELPLSGQCPHRAGMAPCTRPPTQNPACSFPAPGSPGRTHSQALLDGRMTSLRVRQFEPRAVREVAPEQPVPLAASAQYTDPLQLNLVPYRVESPFAVVQSEVLKETTQHRRQLPLLVSSLPVPMVREPLLRARQKLATAFPAREANYRKFPAAVRSAYVRETQEIKRLGSLVVFRLSVSGEASEEKHPRFIIGQCQVKPREPIPQVTVELLRVPLVLETHHKIVSEPHQISLPLEPSSHLFLEPQVEHKVQIPVSQERAERTTSASRSEFLTRLNTRPARSPVNASTPPLRAAPHDSGPIWVANPLSYDFFIHYTSPVLTGAQGEKHERDAGPRTHSAG